MTDRGQNQHMLVLWRNNARQQIVMNSLQSSPKEHDKFQSMVCDAIENEPELRVTRFRSLHDLAVGPFARVNLITGKNNSGKSSLLEAVRILATEGAGLRAVKADDESQFDLTKETKNFLAWQRCAATLAV
jgi:recombinational DNA repair ATPase RecF